MNRYSRSQHFLLPGPRYRSVQEAHTTTPLAGSHAPKPSAGIESELKLLMPLSAEQTVICKTLTNQAQIRLAYFQPGEARRVINQISKSLPYLVVDGESFAAIELGHARVARSGGSTGRYFLEIRILRRDSTQGKMQRRVLSISNKLARLLQQESDPARRARLVMKHAGPFIIEGNRISPREFISARLREVRARSTVQRSPSPAVHAASGGK